MKDKITLAISALALSATFCACESGKSDKTNATADSTVQQTASDAPYADPSQSNTYTATLAGHRFEISIKREADNSLPTVTDELGKKFYDNRVDVTIKSDGEAFFTHSYTREAFADFLSDSEKQGTVLLGMAFDSEKSDGHAIRLGAQIGQVGIEEGPAFTVEIPLDGSASSIVRDKNQDTTGDDGLSD